MGVPPRKLALYGLAGSGKSTVAANLKAALEERGHTVQVIKLAEPLYRIQGHIYATAGKPIGPWEHDNDVLRTVATWLRRINPDYLADDFLTRVAQATTSVVINDDLRDAAVDYPRLAAAGFVFVHVTCTDEVRAQRLHARGDHTIVPDSNATWGYDTICADYSVDTTTLAPRDLHDQVDTLLTKWLAQPLD
ncbi:AAA family ATPase [Kribbella sp. NPDC004875]|uniref:AAA family ATPase n=1 Tax=Kribbella sp. NPDC004875 TaxID=3364107 RepID=UPI0036981D3F